MRHSKLAVVITDSNSARSEELRRIADLAQIPINSEIDLGFAYSLVETEDRLLIINSQDPRQKIYADFVSGPFQQRLRSMGKGSDLAKAIGVNKGIKTVCDATAGWCVDSLVLKKMGLTVTAVEISPVVHALVREAMSALTESLQIELINANALEHFDSGVEYDAIYLDPLFPDKQKSAAVRKEIQVLRDILPAAEDAEALLRKACQVAKARVVVKRAPHSPPILEKPSHQFLSKMARFDVYLT
jgi:16S rRNA (guanine1516-N2)-methyltransferase